jgi:hypothetical protein
LQARQGRDEGPAADLQFGNERNRRQRRKNRNIEPGCMIADQQRRRIVNDGTLNLERDAKDAAYLPVIPVRKAARGFI